jgi:hypothetical protein
MMARRKIFAAIEALQKNGETPPGVDPESHKIRSASILLKRDKVFHEEAKEALRARPGTGHTSV